MLTSGDWVPFTHRYGIRRDDDALVWMMRHTGLANDSLRRALSDPMLRCRCTGTFVATGRDRCVLRATQEDARCDQCREYCYGVRPDGTRVDFPSVSG